MVLTWLQYYLLKVRTSSRISHKKLWLFACAIRARDFLELQTVDYVRDPLRVGPALHFLACLYLQPTDDRMVTPLPTESLRYRANGMYIHAHIYDYDMWNLRKFLRVRKNQMIDFLSRIWWACLTKVFGPVLFQGRYPSDWTEHLLAGWLASLADPTEPASSLNYIQKYLLPVDLVAFLWSSSDTMYSAITFAEAHLQSLVSSLGRRRDSRLRDSPYVKDPMCHGTSMCFRPKATKVFKPCTISRDTPGHFTFSSARPVAREAGRFSLTFMGLSSDPSPPVGAYLPWFWKFDSWFWWGSFDQISAGVVTLLISHVFAQSSYWSSWLCLLTPAQRTSQNSDVIFLTRSKTFYKDEKFSQYYFLASADLLNDLRAATFDSKMTTERPFNYSWHSYETAS